MNRFQNKHAREEKSSEQKYLKRVQKKHARAELKAEFRVKILNRVQSKDFGVELRVKVQNKDTGEGLRPCKGSGAGFRAQVWGSEHQWRQKRGAVLFLESHAGPREVGGRVAKPRDT